MVNLNVGFLAVFVISSSDLFALQTVECEKQQALQHTSETNAMWIFFGNTAGKAAIRPCTSVHVRAAREPQPKVPKIFERKISLIITVTWSRSNRLLVFM